MRRTVLLAVVLALAGCVTGTAPTAESGPEGPPEAAWTDGEGLNTTELARAHFERLREAGTFTVNRTEFERVGGDRRPDGPTPEEYIPQHTVRKAVNLDAGRYHDRYVTVGHRRSAHFVTPEVTASRHRPCPDCDWEYEYDRRPDRDTMNERIHRFRTDEVVEGLNSNLRAVTAGVGYEYDGTVRRDGETLYRYRAERSLSVAPPPIDEPVEGTATLLVTGEGVVREFRLRYTGTATVTVDGGNRTVDVERVFGRRYTGVGETAVERPDWVDRAADRERTPQTETGTNG